MADSPPLCREHGAMERRPGQTAEQVWCGTWYHCASLRCGNAALIPSAELLDHLGSQKHSEVLF